MKELLRRIAQGDMNAFNELYYLSFKKLKYITYDILQDYEQTKDALQETYFKIWKYAKKYVPIASADGWIAKIAKNTAINFYRDNKRHVGKKTALTEKISVTDDKYYFANNMELSYLFEGLTEDEKKLAKYRMLKYDYKYISELTDWKIDRIKYLNQCAKKKMERNRKKYL